MHTFRPTLSRRTMAAALAAMLMAGSISVSTLVAAPPAAAEALGTYRVIRYFSDSTKTVQVGTATIDCEDNYFLEDGYETPHTIVQTLEHCPY